MKKVLLFLLAVLVIIQFIRPEKNKAQGPFPNDITQRYPMPVAVQTILYKACYDCHSNNTTYLWYDEVQPAMWWITSHIKDGKRHLNFNEFLTYRIAKQHHKMEECMEAAEDGWMPLSSYTFMHGDAKLTEAERKTIHDWFASVKNTIKSQYPADSLVLPKKNKS